MRLFYIILIANPVLFCKPLIILDLVISRSSFHFQDNYSHRGLKMQGQKFQVILLRLTRKLSFINASDKRCSYYAFIFVRVKE